MPVSSNTLFHFTDSMDNLVSILKNDFRPHFSLEDLNSIMPEGEESQDLIFAIPMVCFCDIPLSQTQSHMDVYGHYAIGLSKKWGEANGVCPVLYTYPKALLARRLRQLIEIIARLHNTTDDNPLMDGFHDVSCYIKPYEGILKDTEGSDARVRFYDEREWRYVSTLGKESFRYGFAKEGFKSPEAKDAANRHLWTQDQLIFKPNDIKYLIVKTEDEILQLIAKVEAIKTDRYLLEDVKLLTSRVISAELIRSDF